MTKRAFIFPGQGSQSVGMAMDLVENFSSAKAVFEEVSDALSLDMTKLCFEGPEDQLNLTENTQPALMTVSVATARVLEKEFDIALKDHATYGAGHSLGEYSALTALGAFTVADCARLLKIRGQAMQQAVPVGQGAMAAILGLDMDVVQTLASEAAEATNTICSSANDNSPGQVVISGSVAAVEKAIALAGDRGAKRSVLLPVSAPFHCALMQPAADRMAEELANTTIQSPALPIVSNVTARPTTSPDDIRKLLVDQVTGMVRWTESVSYMAEQEGIEEFVEIGAGKVLTGLGRRITKEAKGLALNVTADIESFATRLKN